MVTAFLFSFIFITLVLWLADALKSRFKIYFPEFALRVIPGLIVICLMVLEYLLHRESFSTSLIVSFLCIQDLFLLIYPSSVAGVRHSSFIIAISGTACSGVVILHLCGWDPPFGHQAALTLIVPATMALSMFLNIFNRFSTQYLVFRDRTVFSFAYDFSRTFLMLALCCICCFNLISPDCILQGLHIAMLISLTVMYLFIYKRILEGRKLKSLAEDGIVCSGTPPSSNDSEEKTAELFEKFRTYLLTTEAYLDEDISLVSCAKALGTNKTNLSKAINSKSGSNYCTFVNSLRIDRAKEIIASGENVKILDLATMSGFHTVASFNMAFKQFVNDTPSEYIRTVQTRNSMNREEEP